MSCRDPGSAAQIVELARIFEADGRFEVRLVASGVGCEMLAPMFPETERFTFSGGLDHLKRGDDASELLAAARELVERVTPDAVLVGLSSLGFGVDEALLAVAGGVPTFMFQEFWGDLNDSLGVRPDVILALDEFAVKVTRERWGQAAMAVGSPRHAVYSRLDVDAMRNETRQRLGLDGRKVIGFFSQTSQISGHEDAFGDLVRAAGGLQDRPVIMLREHPKFRRDRDAHASAIRACGLDLLDVTDERKVEPLLAACDVVATCYSTCAYDHAHLSAHARRPVGTTLFLLTNPDIRAECQRLCGFEVFPTAAQGVGFVARNAQELRSMLAGALTDAAATSYHEASKALATSFSPEVIADTVYEMAVRQSGFFAKA
jgi:hypothetical protein